MNTVSIVVPVYNVAPYIDRCLQSIMRQTFPNIECILINDCGSDNSMDIVNNLIQHYKGPIVFKILHHDHNRGLSAARNTGINAATGDYLFFLDSDDEIKPDAISLFIQETQHHPELEMVIGNVTSVPHNDYYDLKITSSPFTILNNNNTVRLSLLYPQQVMPVMAWNKLIKLDFIKKHNLIFKEGIIHEDEHWIFFVVKYLKTVSFISDKTYIHYETSNSIMSTTSQIRRAECIMNILLDIIKSIDTPYSDLQLLRVLNQYFSFFNFAKETKNTRKVRLLIFYQLLLQHSYKAAFHFLIHKYRNRSVQELRFIILPQITQSLTIKYKDSSSTMPITFHKTN